MPSLVVVASISLTNQPAGMIYSSCLSMLTGWSMHACRPPRMGRRFGMAVSCCTMN
jgi:hypothetical protein